MTITLELPASQTRLDAHSRPAGGATTPARAKNDPKPKDGTPVQGSTPEGGGQGGSDAHPTPASPFGDFPKAMLAIASDVIDDLERTRIATENRLRSIEQDGLSSAPQYAALATLLGGIKALEHAAELNLKRTLRTHPLGPWVKVTKGVGEKQGARLIAAIGDPYWNSLHDRPRTVSELWAFCGYHVIVPASHPGHDAQNLFAGGATSSDRTIDDASSKPLSSGRDQLSNPGDHGTFDAQSRAVPGVAARRAKGQRANWSANAKMRAYLVAESCMKGNGPYRLAYEAARVKYADSLHGADCARCGPKGKPALAGTPLSAGHQHARSLRLVAKEILRDLWLASKAVHDGATA